MNDQQPKESKTAEELKDERLLIKRIWSRAYLDTEESHIELIKAYADQQVNSYKGQLRKEVSHLLVTTGSTQYFKVLQLIDEI